LVPFRGSEVKRFLSSFHGGGEEKEANDLGCWVGFFGATEGEGTEEEITWYCWYIEAEKVDP